MFVSPAEAEAPPVMNAAEPVNPMACAKLPSSATPVLSDQLLNIGAPPKSAVAVPAWQAGTPVADIQPNGQAGYCNNPILGPTEYYAGTWYYSAQIPPLGSVPNNATIYAVAWTYSLSRTPPGQRVWCAIQWIASK